MLFFMVEYIKSGINNNKTIDRTGLIYKWRRAVMECSNIDELRIWIALFVMAAIGVFILYVSSRQTKK